MKSLSNGVDRSHSCPAQQGPPSCRFLASPDPTSQQPQASASSVLCLQVGPTSVPPSTFPAAALGTCASSASRLHLRGLEGPRFFPEAARHQ